VSTIVQHPVDNLRCKPVKVTGTLPPTRPESNQTGSGDSENHPFDDGPASMTWKTPDAGQSWC